jgi:hypothetical protein
MSKTKEPKYYRLVIIDYLHDSYVVRSPEWGKDGLPNYGNDKLFTFKEAVILIPKIREATSPNGFVSFNVAMIPLFEEDLKPYLEGGLL